MPVTRGRARLMESQEDDVEGEPSHQMQETQEEEEEEMPTETDAVDLKEMAKQLTKTLKRLLTTHRQLENDANMIQAGMDELHGMQEERAKVIAGRLKNASSTILTFGDASPAARPDHEDNDTEDERMD